MTTNPNPPDPVALALSQCYAFLLARRRQRLAAQEKARTEIITPDAGNFAEQAESGAQEVANDS